MVKSPTFRMALLYLAACSAPQVAPAPTPPPRGGDDCVGGCAAGLTCFLLESSPNGRGVCAVEVTIAELATRTRYEGALVGVRHASFGSTTVCTEMACDCCNSCTQRTTISDGTDTTVLAARSSGEPYVIKADECAIKTMSSGLPSGSHTIVGVARSTETEGQSLRISHVMTEKAER